MGYLEDLLEAGLISESEYDTYMTEGYFMRHTGNTESIQDMMEIAYRAGLDELGDRLFEEWNKSIDYYEAENAYTIYYNPETERWHDVATHKFVADPYEWVRD